MTDAAAQDGGCFSYSLPLTGDPATCDLSGNFVSNSAAVCHALCHSFVECYGPPTAEPNQVVCGTCFTGRRPEGFTTREAPEATLGHWFSNICELEAASVQAFAILRNELKVHHAPRRLVRAAERARRDEIRHARVMSALARRYGGAPHRPNVEPHVVRHLEAIALENAVEGCVRETYGTLVAMWQAQFAGDTRVRGAMKRIAEDEVRHAALGWQVAAWIEPRLSPRARVRVRGATREAIAELGSHIDLDPPTAFRHEAGVPSAHHARILFRAARRALWGA